ncbi:site-specific DNA-methyltransferase [Candidatus Peregrinibacteria bacterium]|nr:site-specific DNA-methyltransferase [Candidatus Peregrinibacteria bacterium]
MILHYPQKRTPEQILFDTEKLLIKSIFGKSQNKLIKGDNLRILKTLLEDFDLKNKIDLIYIDPPFATNNYFTIGEERVSTISNSKSDKTAYTDNLVGHYFLEFLRERLIFLRELLSEEGSIYLHIDYKIGHYVKIIMDEIFGVQNFKNDITRIKCNPKNFKRKAYGNIKDMILFYSKGSNPIWNDPKEELNEQDINRLFKKTNAQGRRYTTIPLHAPGETQNGATGKEWKGQLPPKGRHWRTDPKILDKWDKQGLIEWSKNGNPRKIIFADEKDGKKRQDIWDFKDLQYPTYPTEKNLDLLKTIVLASSNPESIVLDCFCGSGTTLRAAQELGRKWIGIDQSEAAIKSTEKKLKGTPANLFAIDINYEYYEEDTRNHESISIRRQTADANKKMAKV